MVAIGIDVGGTSIKGASITSDGQVGKVFSMPVIKGEDGNVTIEKLAKIVKDYIKEEKLENDIVGIGLGIPGTIESTTGVCSYSNNLKWENVPVVDIFHKYLDYPVRITNDANAATLGEFMFGAGKDYQNCIMITLGTGVGSGVIVDGRLYEGNEGKGSELGHTVIELNGRQCTCGRKGCFEQYASATAIINDSIKAMEAHPESLMHDVANEIGKVNGMVPFEAMRRGDEAAKEVVNNYIFYLGEGLLNICNIFRPAVIILSGGIANEGDNLLVPLKQYLKENQYGYPRTPAVEIIVAKLGYDSGKIGAAALFFEK